MTFDPDEIRERWRIDLSDEHIYRLDAVSKNSETETVCEFKRGSARADAHRVMDALSRVEAQDKEIKRLKQKIEDQDDYIGTRGK